MFQVSSDEHLMLVKESARNFAMTYIKPHVMAWDEAQLFLLMYLRN